MLYASKMAVAVAMLCCDLPIVPIVSPIISIRTSQNPDLIPHLDQMACPSGPSSHLVLEYKNTL